jgi:hypothetical protein
VLGNLLNFLIKVGKSTVIARLAIGAECQLVDKEIPYKYESPSFLAFCRDPTKCQETWIIQIK